MFAELRAALLRRWRTSVMRRRHMQALRWRTVHLLESLDQDVSDLEHTRDVLIPACLDAAADEKRALLRQLDALSTDPWPPIVPRKTNQIASRTTA